MIANYKLGRGKKNNLFYVPNFSSEKIPSSQAEKTHTQIFFLTLYIFIYTACTLNGSSYTCN